jgi:multidrug resistance efflux pump
MTCGGQRGGTRGPHQYYRRAAATRRHCPAVGHYRRGAAAIVLAFLALSATAACGSRSPSAGTSGGGVVIINSPATGVVRRVLVREGARVGAGDPVVEITLPAAPGAAARPTEDPQKRAVAGYTTAQGAIEAARAEVVRTQVEVQRLGPLVAAGQASQGELDGAQALYQRAQQKLQEAQTAASRAEGELASARSRPASTLWPSRALMAVTTPPAEARAASTRSAGRGSV